MPVTILCCGSVGTNIFSAERCYDALNHSDIHTNHEEVGTLQTSAHLLSSLLLNTPYAALSSNTFYAFLGCSGDQTLGPRTC